MPIINPGLPTESYYPDPRPKFMEMAPDAVIGKRVRRKAARAANQRWTTGDGSRVDVCLMSDSHLFYALAKARRNEYPDSVARRTGVEALEAEALRRLAGL